MSIRHSYPAPLPTGKADTDCHEAREGWPLFRRLETLANTSPDAFAVGQTTYRALLDAGLTLAGYMQQRLGVRAGDRVLLLVQDSEPNAIAACAIARCDAVAVAPAAHDAGPGVPAALREAAAGTQVAIASAAALPALAHLLDEGLLYGCIVCGGAESARPGVHDFAGALSAGIAPVPLPVSHRSGQQGVV